ncbi:xylanase [Frankia sp. AgKG'84/4]|uniref:xylanase n=1 Tax=Frankia sp. AgKG'84/4 TaxID=573490 RepID=UPI002010AD9B|nr:xylanase [Frankia sp. AgKG'84/4]MCL9793867.1 xylanase [Frankia sp. AgKG'84/4]
MLNSIYTPVGEVEPEDAGSTVSARLVSAHPPTVRVAVSGAPARRETTLREMRTIQRGLRVLLIGTVIAVAAGCSSASAGSSKPSPTTAAASTATHAAGPSSPTPTVTSTFQSTGDPIIDAYVQFWAGLLDAQTIGDPQYLPMTQHATGQALAWAQETIRAYVANGWVREVRDGYRSNDRLISRTSDTGRVGDVQDWSLWPLLVRETGEAVLNSTPRQCITADLKLQGTKWLVTTIAFAQSGC